MNNPVIISTGIALVTLVVTILTALWLQQHFVAKMISLQTDLFDAKLGKLTQLIESQTELFEARIAGLRAQIDSLDGRMTRIERQLDGILKLTLR